MTQDEIIEMAHEAGLHIAADVNWMPVIGLEYAEKFAKLVANEARFEAAEEAWKTLIGHGIGWELRKAVTDSIHAKDQP